ncbi:MAG: HD domain-containing protein [Deltaproteobacteria bacterium]|nr:HD domain-containing protein [Deltaproteobacteria bacterium]
MDQEDLKHMKIWFDDHVTGYHTDDSGYNYPLQLKKDHTKRVCENIVMIGKAMNLSGYELILAETMALFHDIGRFEQYAKYGTFSDLASENHAKLSLRQMAIHGVLSKKAKDEKRLITKAIAYHNAAALPDVHDERELFYMRLLRDADKLDIWKVVIDYYHNRDRFKSPAIELNLSDDPIWSGKIIDAVANKKTVHIKDVKTLNDFKLLQISWAFDLNFTPSFQTVEHRKYLHLIEATLPQSPEIENAVALVHSYVKSHL